MARIEEIWYQFEFRLNPFMREFPSFFFLSLFDFNRQLMVKGYEEIKTIRAKENVLSLLCIAVIGMWPAR